MALRGSLGDKINIEGTQLSFTKMVRSEEEPATTPKNKIFFNKGRDRNQNRGRDEEMQDVAIPGPTRLSVIMQDVAISGPTRLRP